MFFFFPFWPSWFILKIYFLLHLFIHFYCKGLVREAGIHAWSQDRQCPSLLAIAPCCWPKAGQWAGLCGLDQKPTARNTQGSNAVGLQLWLGPAAEPGMKAAPLGQHTWLWLPLQQLLCSWPRPPEPNPHLLWSLTDPTHPQFTCILKKARIIPSHWGA